MDIIKVSQLLRMLRRVSPDFLLQLESQQIVTALAAQNILSSTECISFILSNSSNLVLKLTQLASWQKTLR